MHSQQKRLMMTKNAKLKKKKKENKTKNTQTPKHDARTQERLNNKEHKGPNMKSSH